MEHIRFRQLTPIITGRPKICVNSPFSEFEPLSFRLDFVGSNDIECHFALATPIDFGHPAVERPREYDLFTLEARRLKLYLQRGLARNS